MAVNKKTVAGGSAGAVAAIVAAIFAVEGGFTADPNDKGNWTSGTIGQGTLKGTNHGISAMAYPTLDIAKLTQEQATNIYIRDYITKPGYGDIITMSPAVGLKIVDAGVNAGTSRSSTWFQQGLNSLNRGGADYASITVDGKVGPASVAAYTGLVNKRGKIKACEMIIKLLDAQQTIHYTSLTNLSQYTPGWIDARIGNVPLEKCRE